MNALRGTALRLYRWLDDRIGITDAVGPLVRHPVPPNVNWWYVFGSAALIAFVIQVITGVALAFTYVPAPNSAYESIRFITEVAVLGRLVRGIHWFGASAMVILVVAHLAQVFLSGSYKFPRELNWLVGAVLLLLTLGMAFTGQILRWNQDAYWGTVVAASQAARTPVIGDVLVQIVLAGQTVGGATLTRFYATHVFLIPALMFGLIGLHLLLVIRHGIAEPPVPGRPVDPRTYREEYDALLHRRGIPFWPDAAWRDVAFAFVVGVGVVGLAILIGPPELGVPADPTVLHAYPRPDWYFLWLFALLALTPPQLEDWVILGLPLLAGLALFALPLLAPYGERSPSRRPWAVAAVLVPALAVAVLLREGYAAPWSPELPPPPLPAAVTQPLSGSALQGAQLFQQQGCISCHAIAGTGGQRGPDLTYVGSRLTPDQLTWRILNGGTNMPAYGDTLTPQETDSLVSFLSQRTQPTGPQR
jgi:ubiquinol-cytochrome c reductase cytochrome b subunit